jgi:endonuclease-3
MDSEYIVEVLETISKYVGTSPEDLAVTVASRLNNPFAVLVSTILSLRTRDEVTAIVTPRFLSAASTPQETVLLTEEQIENLIYPTSFYRMKSKYILNISKDLISKFDGKVPDSMEDLLTLKGIGRKSANLIINLAFKKDGICVDAHVGRIVNRLGFVQTSDPEATEYALMSVLPQKWWIPINGDFIAFGRKTCTPTSPRCSSCPVSHLCEKNGVKKFR